MVSFLLIKGANPTQLTIDQYTPLQLAVQHHAFDILEILLNQPKVDVNQMTDNGTALHLAVRNEDVKCLEMLLRYDASIEVVDNQGRVVRDVCKDKKIEGILARKAEMGKLVTPCIAKGAVYRVSQTTKRLK